MALNNFIIKECLKFDGSKFGSQSKRKKRKIKFDIKDMWELVSCIEKQPLSVKN